MTIDRVVATVSYSEKGRLDSYIKLLASIGINFFRINLSKHIEMHNILDTIHKYVRGPKIMFDYPYPGKKPRIDHINGQSNVKRGANYILANNSGDICLDIDKIASSLQVNQLVYYGDGEGAFRVIQNKEEHSVVTALNNFTLEKGKSLSFGRSLKDPLVLNQIVNTTHEYKPHTIALSFVEDIRDIETVRASISDDIEISSKIETQIATNKLHDIIDMSDSVMLGRGDWCLDNDFTKLYDLQKKIIYITKRKKKRIYISTGILSSLQNRYLPSRADIIDITTLIDLAPDYIVLNNLSLGLSEDNILNLKRFFTS